MMKSKRIISLLLSIIMIVSIMTVQPFAVEENDPYHRHGVLYTFDENAKRIYGVYKGNLIERLILDVGSFLGYGKDARIYSNGEEVFEGELQEGMTVKIYRLGVFYGEYEIAELLEPYPQPELDQNIAQ